MFQMDNVKRFKLVACKVLQKEAYFCAARSKNVIDIAFMPQGLHKEPDTLRAELKNALKSDVDIHERPYDAILLGYGLCSNGIIGLSAKVPIVVPRGHDCVTLLLGSKERYQEYFDSHRGTYWYSPGWIDTGTQPGRDRYESKLSEYREKYGDDNAEYLMETEQTWMKEYSWATYIEWHLPASEQYKQYTKDCAEYLHWQYESIEGDPCLIQKLLDGDWDAEDFLVIKPGEMIAEDLTNPGLIKPEPAE